MDGLEKELGRLENKSNLDRSISEIDKIIAELKATRKQVEQGASILELTTLPAFET